MSWGIGTVAGDYSGLKGLSLGPVSWTMLRNYYYSSLNPDSAFAQSGGTFAAILAYSMLPDNSRGSGLPLSDAQKAQKAAVERGDYIAAYGSQWPTILGLAIQGAIAGAEPTGWSSITLPVEIASSMYPDGQTPDQYLVPIGQSGTQVGSGAGTVTMPPIDTTPPAGTGTGSGGRTPPIPPDQTAPAGDNTLLIVGGIAALVVLYMVTQK